MGLGDLISRFLRIESRVKRQLPITAMAPLEAIRTANGTIIRDMRATGYDENFDGWITDHGPNKEADLTGPKYWVKKGVVADGIAETNDIGDLKPNPPPPDLDADGNEIKRDIVTVSNEAEMTPNAAETPSGTVYTQRLPQHLLMLGRHVRVRAIYAVDGTRHYVMNEPILLLNDVTTRVDLVHNSGGAGSDTVICTFTYDMKYPVGTTNVVGINFPAESGPCRGFPMKVNTPAVAGLAYWHNGVPILTIAYESTGDKVCTA